jgi:hypothetical protein
MSALKEHFLDVFAEHFQAAGIASLAYDVRCFGESEGLPRLESDPEWQTEDYHDAVTYVASLPDVDPERIALWGSSYSGSIIVQAAAIDKRVKAVVAQVPFLPVPFMTSTWNEMMALMWADRTNIVNGGECMMIPVIADSLEQAEKGEAQCVLSSPAAYKFFVDARSRTSRWENQVTIQSVYKTRRFSPKSFYQNLGSTPLLLVLTEKDVFLEEQLAVFETVKGPKEKIMIEGDHFDVCGKALTEVVAAQIAFLKMHL